MISHQKYLEEQLKGEAFRQAYEDELLLAQAAIQIAQRRQQQGLTQEELARKAHLKPEGVVDGVLAKSAAGMVKTLKHPILWSRAPNVV